MILDMPKLKTLAIGAYVGWALAFGYFGLPDTSFLDGVLVGLLSPLIAFGAALAMLVDGIHRIL